MKKIGMLCLLFFWTFSVSAQSTDSLNVKEIMQMVRQLKEQQDLLRKNAAMQRVQDSLRITVLRDSLAGRNQQITKIDMELGRVNSRANELSERIQLTAKGRYDVIAGNLTNTAYLFEKLNERINTLQALSQTQSYQATVTRLNNPTDNSMGFSFEGKVMELLDKTIPVKKNRGKFMAIAQSIIKNPTVQGLVNTIAPVPIVEIGNNIISFVSSLGFMEKTVDAGDVSKFKEALGAYTVYYSKLNEANTSFQVSTDAYAMELSNLHQQLEDFSVNNIREAGFTLPARSEGMSSGEYLNLLYRNYNERNMYRYLDELKTKNSVNGKPDYEKLLNTTKLEVINSRIDDVVSIYKAFDYQYRRYLTLVKKNNEATVEVLEFAVSQKLSEDEAKIKAMIVTLNQGSKESISRTVTSINITQLDEIAKKIVR